MDDSDSYVSDSDNEFSPMQHKKEYNRIILQESAVKDRTRSQKVLYTAGANFTISKQHHISKCTSVSITRKTASNGGISSYNVDQLHCLLTSLVDGSESTQIGF